MELGFLFCSDFGSNIGSGTVVAGALRIPKSTGVSKGQKRAKGQRAKGTHLLYARIKYISAFSSKFSVVLSLQYIIFGLCEFRVVDPDSVRHYQWC